MKSLIQKLLLVLIVVFNTAFAADDFQVEFQPQIMEKIVTFKQTGILKQKENGYLYVEIERDFIAETLPILDVPGHIVPPRHYKSKKGIGAHISVMYENEQIENEIWEIKELGQEFTFEVMEIRTVKLYKDNQVKKLWLIAVFSPELEKLRESYGLPPKLKNHDFHITIGTQIPGKSQEKIIPQAA